MTDAARYQLQDLKLLMDRLRDPKDGCPWDLDQSYRTIAPSTIEEAYEVVDAIEKDDMPALKEELGDLLFQVVFYARLAEEEKKFDLHDIIHTLVAKLIRRHPHVFPAGTLESRMRSSRVDHEQSDIKTSWESIKRGERKVKGQIGVLDDVPINLPALTRAQKLQKRAASVGFDWADYQPVFDKIREELEELQDAMSSNDPQNVEEELGDLLFSCVNLSRHLKVDAETALRHSQQKFERRFRYIESRLASCVTTFEDCDLVVLDALWSEAKAAEKRAESSIT